MSSRRVLKVAEAIREVVSMAILIDLRDPRVSDVTVTRVSVSGDLRLAKVYVSIMGDEKKQSLCMHGLNNAKGFLQRRVGDRVDTRFTPKIEFVLDMGVKHSLAVAQILDEVLERTPPEIESDDEFDPASSDFEEAAPNSENGFDDDGPGGFEDLK
ncbi:MAG TPA: 30S ribosome-binding factor RbfA [Pirellulaceae bacterium]|nr:30S ribosome-binding factor RbfA [Pirellulaceae bacterium]HMO92163.1 30S ribosome-binding factor RbfA [Pirellulaceae bacterium]HMP68910.1 30S ribosome-binding factor RbfA [Pirellulaceae bacterium]